MKANATTLNPNLLRKPGADWRPANDLSVPQIYLYENPRLKSLLALARTKACLLGHWRTLPVPARSSGPILRAQAKPPPTAKSCWKLATGIGAGQNEYPEIMNTARTLVAGDKGVLPMDESNPTGNKRFAKLGIPKTGEARRAWRELIVTTPRLGECISGAILYDETIRQRKMALPLLKPLPLRESLPLG